MDYFVVHSMVWWVLAAIVGSLSLEWIKKGEVVTVTRTWQQTVIFRVIVA